LKIIKLYTYCRTDTRWWACWTCRVYWTFCTRCWCRTFWTCCYWTIWTWRWGNWSLLAPVTTRPMLSVAFTTWWWFGTRTAFTVWTIRMTATAMIVGIIRYGYVFSVWWLVHGITLYYFSRFICFDFLVLIKTCICIILLNVINFCLMTPNFVITRRTMIDTIALKLNFNLNFFINILMTVERKL
jgi:hypothetical protein